MAGLPVAVHRRRDAARRAVAEQFAEYGVLPNYRRILDIGGAAGPAEAAVVGDEASVTAQLEALFAAGATDVWAAPSRSAPTAPPPGRRTRDLLNTLVG